jgi:hypothetical protein
MLRQNTSSGFTSRARNAAAPIPIKRDLRRRSAIEPVIGHAKSDHRMDRNYLKGSEGGRHQRRARRRRVQLPPIARVAQAAFARMVSVDHAATCQPSIILGRMKSRSHGRLTKTGKSQPRL